MAAVTLVGAGRIGLPVVANLVASGHSVDVVDTDERRRVDVIAAGASWTGAQLGAVAIDRILITVLPDDVELAAVMLDPGADDDGARLRHLRRGGFWIDMTSVAPDMSASLAAAAAACGVRYLDAAISGGPVAAQGRRLTLYVGGADDDLTLAMTVLTAFADDIRHVGDHGTGHLTKLLVNQLWFGQAAALAEVFLLGTQGGVAPDRLLAALIDSPADSAFVREYLPRVLDGDYVPAFELSRIVHELDSLERAATAAGTPWTVAGRVAALHREALGALGDRDGELSVIAWLEDLAGRRLRPSAE